MTMSMPLFQGVMGAEPYEPPDYDEIEREQDRVDARERRPTRRVSYTPAPVSEDELAQIKEDMRLTRTQITPDTLRHALEAEEIRKALRHFGIRSLRKVSATRDFQGVVKLTFDEFRVLVERLLQEASVSEKDD
jgi:hypothetical protein